jgi:serine phosphatase RsbU (regulator of sigma subunit)
MAVLYIYPKAGVPGKAALESDRVSIGRSPASDIVLADSHCSSCHAIIERAGEHYVIRDAGSKNGTFVNDVRLTAPQVLSPGDEISLGSTTLRLDRPRMPRVTIVDAPGTRSDASASVPFREILEKTSVTDVPTSKLAAPASLREENRILQVLNRVGEALVAHKPVPELLEDILDVVAANLPMDQCVILLRNAAGGGLETRAARIQGAWQGKGEIRVSRSVVAMAFERHLSVLLDVARTEFDPSVSIIEQGIRSALCVPIGDGEDVIGVLYADRHQAADAFEDADLRLLTLLANTAGVKIQQARQVAALIEAQKAQRELRIAADIQRDFLPRLLPSCEGYGMAGRAIPCLDVGGDYFDCFCFAGRRIGLTVADVSGKGVGAALLMASLRAWLRAEIVHGTDLAAMAEKLNDFVHESSDAHTFISFLYAELDRDTGGLRYVNAGHNPGLVLDRDGIVRELGATGLCLGMLAGRAYEVRTAELRPGEILILYTDGITESRDAGEKEFGVQGLIEAVAGERAQEAPAILDGVYRRLAEFAGCVEPFDDRTLVVVKRKAFVSAPSV